MFAKSRQVFSAAYTKISPIVRWTRKSVVYITVYNCSTKKGLLHEMFGLKKEAKRSQFTYFPFILCLIINVVLKVLGLHVD
jgi:hypothetical protein